MMEWKWIVDKRYKRINETIIFIHHNSSSNVITIQHKIFKSQFVVLFLIREHACREGGLGFRFVYCSMSFKWQQSDILELFFSYFMIFFFSYLFLKNQMLNKYLNDSDKGHLQYLTLLGLGLIKINDVSANFNNPRPSLILNN